MSGKRRPLLRAHGCAIGSNNLKEIRDDKIDLQPHPCTRLLLEKPYRQACCNPVIWLRRRGEAASCYWTEGLCMCAVRACLGL
jgi:hypothetical protein